MVAKHAILLHAKSFLTSPVAYLASLRRLCQMGTQVERWSDLANFDPAWDARTAMIAVMIPKNSAVLEFGSGREQLEKFLPEGCTYQPCDLAPRSARTLVCNLNEGFPALPQRYDVIVFSGVIEYIHDLDALFRHVRASCTSCIVSYAATDDLDCVATRMRNGWVHHYAVTELVALFEKAGFTVAETARWQAQTIFRLA